MKEIPAQRANHVAQFDQIKADAIDKLKGAKLFAVYVMDEEHVLSEWAGCLEAENDPYASAVTGAFFILVSNKAKKLAVSSQEKS